jgi:hypothetical protein
MCSERKGLDLCWNFEENKKIPKEFLPQILRQVKSKPENTRLVRKVAKKI